jgi:hypothetical protein
MKVLPLSKYENLAFKCECGVMLYYADTTTQGPGHTFHVDTDEYLCAELEQPCEPSAD